jgi:hypothetical protein
MLWVFIIFGAIWFVGIFTLRHLMWRAASPAEKNWFQFWSWGWVTSKTESVARLRYLFILWVILWWPVAAAMGAVALSAYSYIRTSCSRRAALPRFIENIRTHRAT